MASLLGFLVLNYNPAKIFMDDSGSLSLGFVISVLAVRGIEYIHPVVLAEYIEVHPYVAPVLGLLGLD